MNTMGINEGIHGPRSGNIISALRGCNDYYDAEIRRPNSVFEALTQQGLRERSDTSRSAQR
jgi:hypothetical protein